VQLRRWCWWTSPPGTRWRPTRTCLKKKFGKSSWWEWALHAGVSSAKRSSTKWTGQRATRAAIQWRSRSVAVHLMTVGTWRRSTWEQTGRYPSGAINRTIKVEDMQIQKRGSTRISDRSTTRRTTAAGRSVSMWSSTARTTISMWQQKRRPRWNARIVYSAT